MLLYEKHIFEKKNTSKLQGIELDLSLLNHHLIY